MAWRRENARAGAARFRKVALRRRRTFSGPALVYALCLGLLLGLYGPGWLTDIRAQWPALTRPMAALSPAPADMLSAKFGFCHSGGGTNCVVDGDTFWFRGEKFRISDIDTPETHGPRCAEEARLGARATTRLQELMNAGAFTLESGARDTDRYGRSLRVVTRGGQSIGGMLVDEGLARPWEGARRPWC
jgi:endonuclease YncB( thermonuclease family)